MKKISLKDAVKSVQDSPSSILSKEDVLTLLDKISVGIGKGDLQTILDDLVIFESNEIEDMVRDSRYELKFESGNEVVIDSINIDQFEIQHLDTQFKGVLMLEVTTFINESNSVGDLEMFDVNKD